MMLVAGVNFAPALGCRAVGCRLWGCIVGMLVHVDSAGLGRHRVVAQLGGCSWCCLMCGSGGGRGLACCGRFGGLCGPDDSGEVHWFGICSGGLMVGGSCSCQMSQCNALQSCSDWRAWGSGTGRSVGSVGVVWSWQTCGEVGRKALKGQSGVAWSYLHRQHTQ
jgi:hypothetical protein